MPKSTDVVSTYLAELPAEQQDIATRLRRLIRVTGKGLQETVKWGYPCYVGAGNVCSIIPHADHVNLQFYRGADLNDPDGLLEGAGKGMRHVKLWSARDVRRAGVAGLIRAAVAVDQQRAE